MIKLPPLWRDYDGLGQITAPPGHLTLLTTPHLYPFLSRLPVLFVSALQNATHLGSLQLNINRSVLLNDAGLFLLVLAQQLCLLFALALLIVSSSRHPIVRCVIIIALLCNPILFVAAQLISSEALASILAIGLIAIAIELSRQENLTRNGLTALGLCLYANIMTRHVGLAYVALVPAIYFVGAIAHFRYRPERRTQLRKFLITSAIGLIAIVAAKLTTFALCTLLGEPYRSVVARSAIERFDLIDRMPAPQREDYLRKLQAKAPDPITKEAIPAILAAKGYWGESMRVVKELIRQREPELRGRKLDARADHYLSEICLIYYRSAPADVFTDIRETIVRSLTQTSPKEVLNFLYNNAEDSLQLYRSDPDLRKKTEHLENCSPTAQTMIEEAKITPWLRGFDSIPCGITLGLILALAILLHWRNRLPAETLHLVFALAIVNVLILVVTLSLTPYIPRYVLPSCIINAAAVAVLLGGIENGRLPSRARST